MKRIDSFYSENEFYVPGFCPLYMAMVKNSMESYRYCVHGIYLCVYCVILHFIRSIMNERHANVLLFSLILILLNNYFLLAVAICQCHVYIFSSLNCLIAVIFVIA